MRILQICNRIPYPPKDGGAIAMYNLTKGYYEHGISLTMLAINTHKHYKDPDQLPFDFTKLMDLHTVPVNTNIKPWDAFLNLFSNNSYNVNRFDAPEMHEKIASLLQAQTYDVIHLESIYVSMYLDTIRQYSNAKVVLRAHNIEYLIWDRMAQRANPGPKKWYLQLLAKRLRHYEISIYEQFDAILPISDYDESIINKYSPNIPKYVTTAGVNLEDFDPDFSQVEHPSLFHLGSLDWMPNLEAVEWFLNDIWPHVHEQNPSAKFYVAGRNMPDHYQSIKAPNVEVVGEVEDAHAFMNSKAMMVVPLLSGSGMRLKILEGMAMGKCVVSTSIGAEGIKCTDGHDIVIANDRQQFINKINELVKDQHQCLRIGEQAIELVRHQYTNHQIVKGLLSFYHRLLNREVPINY